MVYLKKKLTINQTYINWPLNVEWVISSVCEREDNAELNQISTKAKPRKRLPKWPGQNPGRQHRNVFVCTA